MKEKRKTRLNKTQGTKTEFLGFGAFADAVTPTSDQQSSPTKNDNNPNNASLRWSPVYTGKDDHLASMVFPRLIKRDATTKVKALQDLQAFFHNDSSHKKQQVDALAHYLFLYYSKLSYESSSAVRAEALLVLTLAASRVPKAFQTLIQQNNKQVLGMMYCCHGDPAAEVRAAAAKYLREGENSNNDNDDDDNEEAYSRKDLQDGIWSYVERMLSYGRASKMHDDLFSTSMKSGSTKNKNDNNGDMNEQQKDQMEERFERIVGSALNGTQAWIQKHGIIVVDDASSKVVASSGFLWKALGSPIPSLRNHTYVILGVCCQKAPSFIFDSTFPFYQSIPQALASEKEAGNIPSLLEALLTYLSTFSKINTAGSPWDTMNAGNVTKNLVKLFKKSCHGASAAQWGPTLLPLLAMLPSLPDQVAVLSAAWKGREQMVRIGDQMAVVSTVSESASFFLLRKDAQEVGTESGAAAVNEDGEPLSKVLARLWLECLKNFLETDTTKNTARTNSRSTHTNNMSPTQQAQRALVKGLGGELRKFDDACSNRPNCALHPIQHWFWSEELSPCILEAEGSAALAMIVQEITVQSKDQGETSASVYLTPIWREKFQQVLSGFQHSSGAIPTVDAYDLIIAILKHCGNDVLVPKDGEDEAGSDGRMSVEKFLLNDVLKWTVIHTSSLSTQKQNKALVRNDFALFGICAAGIQTEEKRRTLWEALLKEVIAAQCNLDLLVFGLVALLNQGKTTIKHLQCDTLDNFAIQVVDDAVSKSAAISNNLDNTSNHNEEDQALTEFLRTFAGLTSGVPALARRQVLIKWVDRACPRPNNDTDENDMIIPEPVLDTLLLLVPSLGQEGANRVIIQAWKQGGQVWDTAAVNLLLKESTYLRALFELGPALLRETLITWSTKLGDVLADRVALTWSERAWRLLKLSKLATSRKIQAPVASMSLVVLGDASLWEPSADHNFYYSCLMYLLRKAESPGERLTLLQSSTNDDGVGISVAILTALAEASVEAMPATRTAKRMDRCAQLLLALGGKAIGRATLEKWLQGTVSSLKRYVEEKISSRVSKTVALISQLCDLMIERVRPRDIFSTNDNGEDLGDEFEREKIAKIFVPILNKETFATLPWQSSFAELVNVAISQCGIGPERGIGSFHYDIFQLILGAESRLQKLLEDPDGAKKETICQELWLLSFSCGFGWNTPSSMWDSQLLMFDPEKITAALLEFIDVKKLNDEDNYLNRAILAWLMTASNALKNNNIGSRVVKYIFQHSTDLLGSAAQGEFGDDALLGLRGISMAQRTSRANNVDVANLNSQAIMQVLSGFFVWGDATAKQAVIGQDFNLSGDRIEAPQPAWRSLSHFPEIVSSTLLKAPNLMVATGAEFSDELISALSIESKRWYALRLLDAIARSASTLGDPTPEKATAVRLQEWTKDLDEEAKGELEEDIEIVSEILPHALMTEMESWSEEGYTDSVDKPVIVGKMLAWLCCLQYVDAFVQKDAANRPSLCAYIDKSGAVHSILNLTILHTDVLSELNPNSDFDLLLRTEGMVDESDLASLVLFRTVEALPSLTRRWWEEYCPTVYKSNMKDFIASHIAPVSLQRELERLKFATYKQKFGDMTVSGSVSSREITALYTQDEIKLKVMIQLPASFPLRSAEVDCSKTLGVPAKRWKLWSLQITMMLNNQGGTLQEALLLWKENVDQEFEGVEPCPVCYSVLHVKTHKLPELACSTCSNRFHSQCLTQWFRSSGKTQCVICQQQWAGTRVKK